jgi:hypothetical protein
MFKIKPVKNPKVFTNLKLRAGKFTGKINKKTVTSLRRGARQNFLRESYLHEKTTSPWKGKSKRSRKGKGILVLTGKYKAAWTGQGSGSTQKIESRSISIGVSPFLFPFVVVHQAKSAFTNVRTSAGGSVRIPSRKIGIPQSAVDEIADTFAKFIATGE